jgi:hypothetical protein
LPKLMILSFCACQIMFESVIIAVVIEYIRKVNKRRCE